MYLKSLTLHGFKSFADKTTFEFSKGVTGIVGPNGCGKSNVVDAIRWVLGETSAKALRGDEMADVIFNGTDKRKPVGMAEVTLTMADCEGALKVDYNEVALTRRVFRDGRSEYRLNNVLCRLRDFHELLAGTGIGRAAYSIMAQGQIDMLLSSKPEDRRSVFEEAAGITKFKGQKKEALRKLEHTEANLLRVADILAEVKRQMGTVQRQAQKARRYQILITDLRTLDSHLGHRQWLEFSGEKANLEQLLTDLLLRLNEAHRELHNTEREVGETREAYHSIEAMINTLRAQAQEMRSQVQSAEGKMGFNHERREELEHRIRKHEEDIEAARQMIDQQEREIAGADEQMELVRASIAAREAAMNEHQGGHQSLAPQRQDLEQRRRSVRESLRLYEGQIAGSDSRIGSLSSQLAADRQRHEMLHRERQQSEQARATAQIEHDELQRELSDLEATRQELDEQLKSLAASIADARRQRDTLDQELNELQRTATQRRSRMEVLQQLLQKGEGLEPGTQAVLRGLDNPEIYQTGVRGLLSSAIEVEPAYLPAIEAALREHLQTVLLTDSELARQLIERLTEQRLGKTSLLAMNLARVTGVPPVTSGMGILPVTGAEGVSPVIGRTGVSPVTSAEGVSPDSSTGIFAATGRMPFAPETGGTPVLLDSGRMPSAPETSGTPVLAALSQVRGTSAAAQPILEHLLAQTVIAPDLATALRIKQQHPTLAIATLAGEFISESGVIHGGKGKDEPASALRREAEARELASQVAALESQLAEKESHLANLRHELEDQQREENSLREQAQRSREQHSQAQGKLSFVQRALQQATSKADSVDWEQQQLAERMATAEQQISEQRELGAQAREAIADAQAQEYELEGEAMQLTRLELESGERLNELRIALTHETATLQALEGRKVPMRRRLSELLSSIERYESEIAAWRERMGQSEAEDGKLAEQIANQREFVQMAEAEMEAKVTERAQAFEKVSHLEQQVTRLRGENASMADQRSKSEVALTRIDLRLENLLGQLQERYQLDPASFTPDLAALNASIDSQRRGRGRRADVPDEPIISAGPGVEVITRDEASPSDSEVAEEVVYIANDDEPTEDEAQSQEWRDAREAQEAQASSLSDETASASSEAEAENEKRKTENAYQAIDWDFITTTVGELRQRLDGIGPVNLDAIQEYEELEQRYSFLDTQFTDLTKSKDELLQVIQKINDTTKAMFSETFTLVRGFFQKAFIELFGEAAQADLILVNEEDPLESGIEIIAKPPGKKLQTISLLSGGERSMTAVALLFSIYQVKPSPFCVLDELDAPLDESNISRFLKMLESFIINSQFIIVTHNKRTMGRADVIYGVTMQERGVSKPVGVRMTTEAKAGNIERQRGIGKVEIDTVNGRDGYDTDADARQVGEKAEAIPDDFADMAIGSDDAASEPPAASSETPATETLPEPLATRLTGAPVLPEPETAKPAKKKKATAATSTKRPSKSRKATSPAEAITLPTEHERSPESDSAASSEVVYIADEAEPEDEVGLSA